MCVVFRVVLSHIKHCVFILVHYYDLKIASTAGRLITARNAIVWMAQKKINIEKSAREKSQSEIESNKYLNEKDPK